MARFRTRWFDCFTTAAAALAMVGCRKTPVATAPDNVSIQVLTSADTAARIADVTIRADNDSVPLVVTAIGAGRFTAAVPAATARIALTILVPGHAPIQVGAWMPREGAANLVVRPRALIRRKTVQNPRVIGDFNHFNTDSAVTLVAGADGVLRGAVEFRGESARFQILGVGSGGRGPWMPVTAWTLTPDGDAGRSYAGVIRSQRDSLFFALDTTVRTAPGEPPRIAYVGVRDSAASEATTIALARVDASQNSTELDTWQPDSAPRARTIVMDRAKRLIAESTDSRVRTEAAVTYAQLSTFPNPEFRPLMKQFSSIVPADSPMITDREFISAANNAMFALTPDSGASPADSVVSKGAVREFVRVYLMPAARSRTLSTNERVDAFFSVAFALDAAEDTTVDAVVAEAVAAFPTHVIVTTLRTSVGSGKVLRRGAVFPSFRMTAIGGNSPELTNDVFRGRLTLVDFWGTWCSPCIWEMPYLHRTFERFKDRGFTILSVASDESITKVQTFREGQWKMPWLHGYVGAGPESPAVQALGVNRFPLAVLVDSTGRIIAVDQGLRKDDLEKTIARLLSP